MATRFRTLACPVDASTGDQRRFAEGALTHQKLPMPLRWVRSDVGGHDGAVTFGAIQSVEFDGTDVWLEGAVFDDVDRETMPRLAEDVAEAMKLIEEGVVGISVDLDDAEAILVRAGTDEPLTEEDFADPDLDAEALITKGRIRSGTLVAIPAFVETNHTFELFPGEVAEPTAVVASLSGATDLPVIDDREHEWDGDAAAGRIFDAYSDEDGNVDKGQAGRAFLWVDGDGALRGDYKLGFADLIDGELKIIPRGVAATAGGRGVDATDIPDSDKAAVKGRICSLYGQVRAAFEDWPECPFDDRDAEAASTAALIASVGVAERVIPLSAFTPPMPITGPTPITYDFTSTPPMAYGHILTWNTCHAGFSDSCVLPPRDPSGEYRDFHIHPVETDAGVMYAGRITAGGVHAGLELGAHQVRKHHDTMEVVADVRATEDEFGLLVCGPIRDGLTDDAMRILSRRKVSGDWRESSDGMPLVEVLALKPGPRAISEPGFPVFGFRNGRQISLTAALGPDAGDQTRAPGYAEIFRTAYTVIREEDARRASEANQRARLIEVLDAALAGDVEMMRQELIRATGD